MTNIKVLHLTYTGDNLKLLHAIEDHCDLTNVLIRASELEELWRVLKYGTDRGGFPPGKTWTDGLTPYEDIVFGTTKADILDGEARPEVSTSFKKLPIIPRPVILLYDRTQFVEIGYHEWKFKSPAEKLKALIAIIIL